jgi:hypothetical protein
MGNRLVQAVKEISNPSKKVLECQYSLELTKYLATVSLASIGLISTAYLTEFGGID